MADGEVSAKRQKVCISNSSTTVLAFVEDETEGVKPIAWETTPSEKLFDVVQQIEWAGRLLGQTDEADQIAEVRAVPEDPFVEAKGHIGQALQEVTRMVEVIQMSRPSAQGLTEAALVEANALAIQQVVQPSLTEAQQTNERLESVVRKKEDLKHAAGLLENGALSLREQLKRGERYRGELRQLRKEFLVRQAVRGGVLVDCSHRSAGSRLPVLCDVSVTMDNDGRVTVAEHVGLEACAQYLRTQLRSNFQAELFQQLSQEGLTFSGTAARYFVLRSNENEVKIECGHAGTMTISLQKQEGEQDVLHVVSDDTGERSDAMEVALQVLLRTRHSSRQTRNPALVDDVVDLLVHRVCRQQVAAELDAYCTDVRGAHMHWYTTNTFTTSAFDLVTPERCIHGTLVGSHIHVVDTLSPSARAQRIAVNELGTFLRFTVIAKET